MSDRKVPSLRLHKARGLAVVTLGGKDFWHIDHIVPLAAFDLSKPAECMVACHFRNHRPFWAARNVRKAAVMPDRRDVPTALRRMLLSLDADFFNRPTYRRQEPRRPRRSANTVEKPRRA
jgi:hypothetical protein